MFLNSNRPANGLTEKISEEYYFMKNDWHLKQIHQYKAHQINTIQKQIRSTQLCSEVIVF